MAQKRLFPTCRPKQRKEPINTTTKGGYLVSLYQNRPPEARKEGFIMEILKSAAAVYDMHQVEGGRRHENESVLHSQPV